MADILNAQDLRRNTAMSYIFSRGKTTVQCPVCGDVAVNHMHYGGKLTNCWWKPLQNCHIYFPEKGGIDLFVAKEPGKLLQDVPTIQAFFLSLTHSRHSRRIRASLLAPAVNMKERRATAEAP